MKSPRNVGGALRAYPDYKPSSVEWLGDVPAHWEVRRLGNLLRERRETNDDGRVTEVLSVLRDKGVIPYAEKGNIGNKKSEDITRYKIVRPDDIVMNSMNVIIGSVGLSPYSGCLSPVYYVLTNRSGEDSVHYLNACFQAKPFQKSLVRIGNGILAHRMRIPMELLKCELLPRPPLAEQNAIVRYLDHVGGRIGRYIRGKEKLVALLAEEKQAVIHQAVTRGLDAGVRLKPSGVEWLGDVPAHWEVRRLKNVCRFAYGDSLPSESRTGNSVPVYGSNGRVGFNFSANTDGQCLIIGRKGSFGKVQYSSKPVFAIDTTFFVDSRCTSANIRWLYYLLDQLQLDAVSKDSAVPGLNRGDAYQQIGVYPPLAEQAAIAAYLDREAARIDAAAARARRQVELMREYRERLIADVVTGKLDVRGAAAKLPNGDEA